MLPDQRPVPSEQALAFILSRRSKAPIWECDTADWRRDDREEALAGAGVAEPVSVVEDVDASGVPARLYLPGGKEREVLVWLHGGGWAVGDLDGYDAVVRALANQAGCAVLSVDYRLAPEQPYPGAVHDCWAATAWAQERFSAVAVGGDSAGGNLSAAVALRARDAGLELALQILVYPMLDCRFDSRSYEEYRARYAGFAGDEEYGAQWQQVVRHVWEGYIPDAAQRGQRDASPLRAESFAGVAPALVITAEHDILRAEAEEYVRLLLAARVPAAIHDYPGQVHGFIRQLEKMDDARDAVFRAAGALWWAFDRGTVKR